MNEDEAAKKAGAANFSRAVAIKKVLERKARISASGRGRIAEKILEMAFASGVKVRQDAELTEILAKFDVGSPIPLEALDVVSEILRYVYLANSELAKARAAEGTAEPL